MALHDFQCPGCGQIRRDVEVPAAIGARQASIWCDPCQCHYEWIPQIGRMDFGPAGGAGFKAFTIQEINQRGELETIPIDSVHKLRQVERQAEQRARNGEGRPLVWRDYAQDRSNTDVHTLASGNLADPHNVAAGIAHHKAREARAGGLRVRRGSAVTAAHGTLPER